MSNFDPIMNILLLPISFLYHIILKIRHKLYDWHLLKSKKFDQPVICVGNLALGGTGKTPHVEYLIKLLSEQYRVCVVSRGYGRKTKGFQLALENNSAETIGDEPMQYFNKYKDVLVAVDENRNRAIELMDTMDRPPELYLLDDAYQHRSTQAGLNILLTAYSKLYSEDFLVPAGTLRDIRSAAKRAEIIMVRKSPKELDAENQAEVIAKLKVIPDMNQLSSADGRLLFCGIANPKPLEEKLSSQFKHLETITFRDHHAYSEKDIKAVLKKYHELSGNQKIIVSTEKDFARLTNSPYLCQFESVPLFVAPISINIHQKEKFNKEILDYVRKDHQHS